MYLKAASFGLREGQTATDRLFNILGWIVTSSVRDDSEKPPNTSRP